MIIGQLSSRWLSIINEVHARIYSFINKKKNLFVGIFMQYLLVWITSE